MLLPYFDKAEVEYDPERNEARDTVLADTALAKFLALTPADRLADSRHVWAYYRDVHMNVGGEDWLDAEMGVPAGPEQIWNHVHPRRLTILEGYDGDPDLYVAVSCACDWEEEGGLYMVWRNGSQLCRVGGHDGHLTNEGEDAYGNRYGPDVVYASPSPEFTTRTEQ